MIKHILIDLDNTIPALIVVTVIAFEIVALSLVSILVQYRMSRKPILALLQAGTKR